MPSALQLNYHLYSNPIPEAFTHNYFISDSIREELQKRSETIHTAPAPGLGLPDELQGYHTLVPLEAIAGDRRKLGNWYSTVYRAINSTDGVTYALRRVEGVFIHPLSRRFPLNNPPVLRLPIDEPGGVRAS
jgi:PAB-dependent poly(A)-specific ribonuclease subunit 3